MHFLGKEYKKKSDVERLRQCAAEIQLNLEALGFTARVAEANILEGFDEFHLEVAVGTDVNKLEKHDRALAMALKSPTGKIQWQIPVPGTYYIGLRLPRATSNREHHEIMHLERKDWRSKIASVFYSFGEANFSIARKILGIE
jgi:hypothetical protein